MTSSRKKLNIQIANLEQQLHIHQQQAKSHKEFLSSGIDYKKYLMIAAVSMIPLLIVWHKRGGNKWLALITGQIMNIGMVAVMTYSKKQALTLVQKYL